MPKAVKILDYHGHNPFGVEIDKSERLDELVARAKELNQLDFGDRLLAVKELALHAMINAYEQMMDWSDALSRLKEGNATEKEIEEADQKYQHFGRIVMRNHSLGYALDNEAGCCRYQGVLFFILGYHADLGDHHYLHTSSVNERLKTVFNEVFENRTPHIVSIFCESLASDKHDYTKQNPKILQNPDTITGDWMYSYHRRKDTGELCMVRSYPEHMVRKEILVNGTVG